MIFKCQKGVNYEKNKRTITRSTEKNTKYHIDSVIFSYA